MFKSEQLCSDTGTGSGSDSDTDEEVRGAPKFIQTIYSCQESECDAKHKVLFLEICRTGPKKQFYTLYSSFTSSHKYSQFCCRTFVKNLSQSKTDALEKTKLYSKTLELEKIREIRAVMFDSPQPVYSKCLAFGNIVMKMSKSRKIWYGTPNAYFWQIWKREKQEVRNAGFWIRKNDDGSWMLFRRVRDNEVTWNDW